MLEFHVKRKRSTGPVQARVRCREKAWVKSRWWSGNKLKLFGRSIVSPAKQRLRLGLRSSQLRLPTSIFASLMRSGLQNEVLALYRRFDTTCISNARFLTTRRSSGPFEWSGQNHLQPGQSFFCSYDTHFAPMQPKSPPEMSAQSSTF